MPAEHPPEYWQAVARGLEAESQKAAVYVTHPPSLGVAREIILRNIIQKETPGQYSIKTGLIRGRDGTESKQCDLIIYNQHEHTPNYQIDEFVVVPPASTRVAIEVKSRLDSTDQLIDTIGHWQSTRPLRVATLVFAYQGMTFGAFLNSMAERIREKSSNSPPCLAVHSRNYLALRAGHWGEQMPFPYAVVDFSHFGDQGYAMATAYFLQWYFRHLDHQDITPGEVTNWFDRLQLPNNCKVSICPNGTIVEGQC